MTPGSRSKFGDLMLDLEVFRKQMCCIEGSTCDVVGIFGAREIAAHLATTLVMARWLFRRGQRGEVPFHNDIIGNLMVDQYQIATIYCSYSSTQKIQNGFL